MKAFAFLLPLVMVATMFASCSDPDPAADVMQGDYRCNVELYTTYDAADGSVRDTTYVGSKCAVVVERVDDNTVSLRIDINQWGWNAVSASSVTLRDAGIGSLYNLSGSGTIRRVGLSNGYPADINGTFNTESKDLTIGVNLKGYYGRRLIFSFTTR